MTAIGAYSFSSNVDVTSVTIPHGVTTIETSAFRDSIRLTTVTIPDSVTSVGGYAFSGCSSLTIASIPAGVTSIGDGLFFGCGSLTTVTIPAGVTSIGDWAFYDCVALTSITIPIGVTSIGVSGFSRCAGLTSVAIPAGVTILENGVFFGCGSLTRVTIPDGVTTIGDFAFFGCSSLTSITIPASVAGIGSRAFDGCSGLVAAYFEGDTPGVGQDLTSFANTAAAIFHRPESSGWTSTFAGRPTATFQPVLVPAGETATATIPAGVSRILKQGPGTLVVDSALMLANGVVVAAGELIVRHPHALGAGRLSVEAAARLTLDVGTERVALPGMTVASTGTIDLGTGSLLVSTGGYDLAALRGLLISGRSDGTWSGAGITSRSVRGAAFREIGYQVLHDGSFVAGYAAVGDANLDGRISVEDLIALDAGGRYGLAAADAGWWQGDFNYDGRVNLSDLIAIDASGLYGGGSYLPAVSVAAPLAHASGPHAVWLDAFAWAALTNQGESESPKAKQGAAWRMLGRAGEEPR